MMMSVRLFVCLAAALFVVDAARPAMPSLEMEPIMLELEQKMSSGAPLHEIEEVIALLKKIRLKIREEQHKDQIANEPTESVCQKELLAQSQIVSKQRKIITSEGAFLKSTQGQLLAQTNKIREQNRQIITLGLKIAKIKTALSVAEKEISRRAKSDDKKSASRLVVLHSVDVIAHRLLTAFTNKLDRPGSNPKKSGATQLIPQIAPLQPVGSVPVTSQVDSEVAAAASAASQAGVSSPSLVEVSAKMASHARALGGAAQRTAERIHALAAHPKLSTAHADKLEDLLARLRATVLSSLTAVKARQAQASKDTVATHIANLTAQLTAAVQQQRATNDTRDGLTDKANSLKAALQQATAKQAGAQAAADAASSRRASVTNLCDERLDAYRSDSRFRNTQIQTIDSILEIVERHIANIRASLDSGISLTGSSADQLAALATTLSGPEGALARNVTAALKTTGIQTNASATDAAGSAASGVISSAASSSASAATASAAPKPCPFNPKDPVSPCAAGSPCAVAFSSDACLRQASAYCRKLSTAGGKTDPACLVPEMQAAFDNLRVSATKLS